MGIKLTPIPLVFNPFTKNVNLFVLFVHYVQDIHPSKTYQKNVLLRRLSTIGKSFFQSLGHSLMPADPSWTVT